MITIRVLEEADKEKIHRESLRILEKVGVRFHSKKALDILKQAGARINYSDCTAYIDSTMVAAALETAPKEFTLGARNERFDFALPSAYTGYTMDGTASFVVDFESGQRRYGTIKDIEKGSRVFETLELGVVNWPPVSASDAPKASRVLHEFFTAIKFTSKHVQHELHCPEEVPFLIEAMKCILGNIEQVKKRKICSVCYCTVAPLTQDGPMSEACIELTHYHIPVLIFPMPSCGSTGPASLYYNLCLANAEGLSSLVLFQAANPGSPQIFGAASGTMDFSNGTFLEGTPEMVIQTTAMAEMARYYNMPNTQAGCLSDSRYPGPEAVMEKVLTTIPLVLAGADLINGIGEIETSQLLVLEQLIIDEEIAQRCRRLREGVNMSEDYNLFEDVLKVGPSGHYLTAQGTLQLVRSKEYYRPYLTDKRTFKEWQEFGCPSLYAKAREKVYEILEGSVLNPLPDSVFAALDCILKKADTELV